MKLMKGNNQITTELNLSLRHCLTVINQYFLHSRMFGNLGFSRLEEMNYKFSIQAMKEADILIKRILFLEGLPNLQDLRKLLIGEDVPEMLKGNLTLEMTGNEILKSAILSCEKNGDYQSREHLDVLADKNEERIDFFETELSLVEAMGIKNYLQNQQ